MAPQTRSAARRTTRSSTKAKASSSIKVATAPLKDSTTSKSTRTRKSPPKPKKKPEPRPTRKRARHESVESDAQPPNAAPRRAKASAKLEVFMNMPVEVFIEIAKYLHPFDLVLLSRVNKFFRELFMSRRATPIWREAQLNIPGLPPCPKSICEPQYAAMLFTKMCSTCGKWAPRNMDPVLLVRLCVKCRDKQAVDSSDVTDWTLVFTSRDLVPGKHRHVSWCLYSDAKAVKTKLNQLTAAGDTDAKGRWISERREEVLQRYADAGPLKEWLQAREQAREAELDQIRSARQAEIESRLGKLGWEKNDFGSCDYWGRKQWKSLTYNAKPLTDRAWEELLPSLLGHLEMNRAHRLEREKNDRRYTRVTKLRDWVTTIKSQLEPLARATANGESSTSTSVENTHLDELESNKILLQSSPSSYSASSWPEFKTLQDTDIPIEDFTIKLDEQHDMLMELITKWRNTFEANLAKLLPEDTQAPGFDDVPGFTLTTGTSEHLPISNLPVDLQKLLRADTIFTGYYGLHFYPDDFASTDLDSSRMTYHVKATRIAKALLNSLNRPNASYLELKALGRAFHCGRCNAPPQSMTWKSIIQHYVDNANEWHRISESTGVRKAKDIAYVFTHDVDLVNPDKPLVGIVSGSDSVSYANLVSRQCKLCQQINIPRWYYEDYIIGHIRDVHLIEEPEPGKHY